VRLAQLMPPLRARTGGSARQAPQCEGIGARDGRPGVAGRRRRARAGDRLRVRLPAGLASWHPSVRFHVRAANRRAIEDHRIGARGAGQAGGLRKTERHDATKDSLVF
jgi:hypothetical protein